MRWDDSRWPLYAGLYALLWGLLLFGPLGMVAETLVKVLGIPPTAGQLLVPVSGAVVGAALWWVVVERRAAYGYLSGGLAGLGTGIATVFGWSGLVSLIYGFKALLVAPVVVVFVLAIIAPVSFMAGLPLMYARRRRRQAASTSAERVVS